MVYGDLKIGRNISISHCVGQRVNSNIKDPPTFVDYSIDIYGCYTEQRATRFARRLTGDNTIVINHVEITTKYYAIPVNVFVDTAERFNNGN